MGLLSNLDCSPRCRLPNAKSVTTALRKVKDLPFSIIANGHGPLLRFNVPEMVGRQVGSGEGHGLGHLSNEDQPGYSA